MKRTRKKEKFDPIALLAKMTVRIVVGLILGLGAWLWLAWNWEVLSWWGALAVPVCVLLSILLSELFYGFLFNQDE
ncbi:MAG: hypothetical protein ACE15C_02580 [Phycisphaerae bacterium]